jgi:hypothetical protein
VDPALEVGACTADGNTPCTAVPYQAETEQLAVVWAGFSDAVGVDAYNWAVGTAPGLSDVHGFERVPPSSTPAAFMMVKPQRLELQDGETYYATVEACDYNARCTAVSSVGIMVDHSPPVAGLVFDGLQSDDADYQADMHTIGCSWEGFHDPHSHVAFYEWCAGTAAGLCDFVEMQSVGLLTDAVATSLKQPVAKGVVVFTTVRAHNNAGLTVEVSSDGCQYDDQKGTITAKLVPVGRLHPTGSGLHAQSSRASLAVEWTTSGFRPGPVAVRYTIASHTGSPAPVDAPVLSYGDGAIIAGLTLLDGDRYFVTATACDGADVCSVYSTSTDGMLVDGSQPSTQGWVETDAWKWTSTSMTLQWGECVDQHSKIAKYTLAVGTLFGTSDIAYETDITGTTATVQFAAGQVASGTIYFATVVCENEAGLLSDPLHAQVQPGPANVLRHFSHSCEVVGCEGDRQCSCGAGTESCAGQLGRCQAPPDWVPAGGLKVNDGFDDTANAVEQHDTSAIRAHWSWNAWGDLARVVRVQYTIIDRETGQRAAGFTTEDRDWVDVAPRANSVTHIAVEGGRFTPGRKFSVTLRVWTSHNAFATYESNGITVSPTGPQLSARERVRERAPGLIGASDRDHTNDLDELSITWAGRLSPVFFESVNKHGASIAKYEVGVGTHAGSDDVAAWRVASSDEFNKMKATVSGMSMIHGKKYFSTVRATDATGLSKVASTDGLRVDTSKPDTTGAVVMDGEFDRDLDYQSSAVALAASWHGFSDAESGVAGYSVGYLFAAPGTKPSTGSTPTTWADVGLATSMKELVPSPVPAGKYWVYVKATNALGIVSRAVRSDGIVVDDTPPEVTTCTALAGANLLINGDFDRLGDWELSGGAAMVAAKGGLVVDAPGSAGSQHVATSQGTMYQVAFAARTDTASGVSGVSPGILYVGSDSYDFGVQSQAGDASSQRQQFQFQFVATSTSTEISFELSHQSSHSPGIVVETAAVRACAKGGDAAAAVHPGPRYQSSFDTVSAQWNVDDEESAIAEFMWAVGTVVGSPSISRSASHLHLAYCFRCNP